MRSHALIRVFADRIEGGTPDERIVVERQHPWLRNEVAQPNPAMTRPYGTSTVPCPFMYRVLACGALHAAVHREVDGTDLDSIISRINGYLPFFEAEADPSYPVHLRAHMTLFPNIPGERENVLTICQKKLKGRMLERGLMIGEFYPTCEIPSVHNPVFNTVMQSPVPAMAVREMKVHDIHFLKGDAEYLRAYAKRFDREIRNDPGNAHLLPKYLQALEKFPKVLAGTT